MLIKMLIPGGKYQLIGKMSSTKKRGKPRKIASVKKMSLSTEETTDTGENKQANHNRLIPRAMPS